MANINLIISMEKSQHGCVLTWYSTWVDQTYLPRYWPGDFNIDHPVDLRHVWKSAQLKWETI